MTAQTRPALVTGGAGFIGSNLVDALVADGRRVVVLDDLSTGRLDNLTNALDSGADLEEVDIVDADAVRRVTSSARPDVVFHLAAQIDVRRSAADPEFDARVNVQGTHNVLAAATETGVSRFVFSSTGGAIYGEADVVPTPENAAQRPLSAYGANKAAAEAQCVRYGARHGLSTVALRYSNVYGPRQDPLGEGGVVAIFCAKVLAGEPPTIFSDGHQTRDFVFVRDVVESNLVAARSEAHGAYNVGTGRETSVLELLDALRELRSAELEPHWAPARGEEVVRSCLDPGLARERLGWAAQVTLSDGLGSTLDSVIEELRR